MNTRTYLSIAGTIGTVVGLGYLLVPEVIGGLIWRISSATEFLFARFIGAYVLLWGLFSLALRNSTDSASLRGFLQVSVIGHVVTVLLFLMGLNAGTANAMGWGNVILSVLLGAGALYCMKALRAR